MYSVKIGYDRMAKILDLSKKMQVKLSIFIIEKIDEFLFLLENQSLD